MRLFSRKSESERLLESISDSLDALSSTVSGTVNNKTMGDPRPLTHSRQDSDG